LSATDFHTYVLQRLRPASVSKTGDRWRGKHIDVAGTART
jgi:hypothetical protein